MADDASAGHGHDHHHDHRHGGRQGWRARRGHHHGPAEALDQALESSAEGIRAVKLSLLALGTTAAAQAAVVTMTGSVALLGDTLHNLADALTALPLWLAFSIGRRPPNRRFTYGYGRAEDLAGVLIVAVIAASAGVAAYQSARRLVDPQDIRNLGALLAAAVVGFAGNEAVAAYRIRVGRRIGSAALVADGWHARTDGLTSLAVLAGGLGAAAGWERADPVAGLAVSAAILVVLWAAARDVGLRLMDAVDPALVKQAEEVVAGVEGVEGVGEVRIRWVGHRLRAEARVVVDRDLGVAAAHDIAEGAHHALLHEVPRLTSAIVHVDPCGHDGSDPHHHTAHHYEAAGQAATSPSRATR